MVLNIPHPNITFQQRLTHEPIHQLAFQVLRQEDQLLAMEEKRLAFDSSQGLL
tara:strand:+ start:615 stop:773 length:159 start_codon:yes stop_codon:yes gene_type:complete